MGGAVVKAAQAVGLEEKEEVKKPVLAGEVEKSIALGRSGLIRNQKKAAVNLWRLSKDSDRVRNQIVDEGGILPLIQMCRSKSQEVQLLAFRSMGELARTHSNRSACCAFSHIPPCLPGAAWVFRAHGQRACRLNVLRCVAVGQDQDAGKRSGCPPLGGS